ncbi:UPF0012 hydrolase in pqqF 5'region [Thalictrum thalictroides]|uniref:UPF0012 hydrolase in pqqF 5'region n=1 Tax=Thalictrum thalictroides TaxID=46969 RepID=A0A7J6VYY0_THATH|nr:UPF0012 hydrolase in pqqF 5'region [Thalictrum thalictroides]
MNMGGERNAVSPKWSIFDNIKCFPPKPETLMAEIEVAISSLEYTHANSLLHPPSPPSEETSSNVNTDLPEHDAKLADEAYKAGCVALASGKLDEALQSLQISLSKCPPDKTSAIAKLQSLITLTSQQLQKPS